MSLKRVCLLGLLLLACGRANDSRDSGAEVNSADAEVDVGNDGGPEANSNDAGPDAGIDGGLAMLRVLFIGNSYVFVNDLPGMLRQIAATAPAAPPFEISEVIAGGAMLLDHWNDGTAQRRIAEGWTHVVLQGQSVEPLAEPALFTHYAQWFGDLAVDAGARPTLFITWARAAGHAVYAEAWSGGTPSAMQDRLNAAYVSVAARWPSTLLARVGDAFRLAAAQRPDVALLGGDGSHPEVAGTYLAACVFYELLTAQAVPETSQVPAGLSPDLASALRAIAAQVR